MDNMSEYQRPQFSTTVYLDQEGLPIEYGSRWESGSPAKDSYSLTSNTERYAPLHLVATAMIEWLQNTFDVVVEPTDSAVSDLLHRPDEIIQAVRVTPRDAAAAPLTFVFTPFPGLHLHAGSLHDFSFPTCGCDACDDNIESLIEELEWTVRTVVSGGYSESLDAWPASWIEYNLNEPGAGAQSGRIKANALPGDRVKLARTVLPADGQWLPWPEISRGDSNASI